jgi:choline dehydrogenase-like flavoprotein
LTAGGASPEIAIIGSGIGGATLACGLAGSGADILVLERGQRLELRPECRDARAIFQRGFFRDAERWFDGDGRPFSPGNYYNIGGNSKFYGAVLIRLREADFGALEHAEGISPAWPIAYADLEPWFAKAELLYQVRGRGDEDPTEPPRSTAYPHPPVPDEPAIAAVRQRLRRVGLHPFSLPLGVDVERWLAHGRTPWDAFPDTRSGKMDAETCALMSALEHPNLRLETGARVVRLVAGPGGRIDAVEYVKDGERRRVTPRLVALCAGAVMSAAILLGSGDEANPGGLANRSGAVGRHFMNHNLMAMLAIDPRLRNDSVYQKTIGFNDFYFGDGAVGPPLGNVQLLGKLSAPILKAQMPWLPEAALAMLASRAVGWLLMSEDLPDPESRVRLDGERIVLEWRKTNLKGHHLLVDRMRERFRAAGFPMALTKAFDRRTPSHQCGTVRFGTDPATSPLDPLCRAFDHPNLFVVDAGFMPSSAAVNPALTIAAQALRVADHIRATDLAVSRA